MDKKCNKCKIVKKENEFSKDKSHKDGFHSQCKICRNHHNKQWKSNNKKKVLEYKKEYQNKKRKNDPIFKLISYIRTRTSAALKGCNKSNNTLKLLGKTGEDLMNWFIPRFYANMTKENYGKVWVVDHIIPCASFDLSNSEEQQKCFHYSNLQPLLTIDNLKKSNKTIQIDMIPHNL